MNLAKGGRTNETRQRIAKERHGLKIFIPLQTHSHLGEGGGRGPERSGGTLPSDHFTRPDPHAVLTWTSVQLIQGQGSTLSATANRESWCTRGRLRVQSKAH